VSSSCPTTPSRLTGLPSRSLDASQVHSKEARNSDKARKAVPAFLAQIKVRRPFGRLNPRLPSRQDGEDTSTSRSNCPGTASPP
jgi:hypothetical protein